MASKICPICNQEFVMRRGNYLIHTYCSRRCRMKYEKIRMQRNKEFRETLGKPLVEKLES